MISMATFLMSWDIVPTLRLLSVEAPKKALHFFNNEGSSGPG